MDFYETIGELINSGREDDYWDFKQQYHANRAELIHDIICMANNRSSKDGYIIFGVKDEPKGEICGVENDVNRRTQQQIIDLIQSPKLKWAFGVYPAVELRTIRAGKHEIDVLIIKSSFDVPYYLTENYSYTLEGCSPRIVRANYIYTRVRDTNTPMDRCATPYQVESLWKHRFGLDLMPLEQMRQKLRSREDWNSYVDDDTGDEVYYNRFSPEYTIRERKIEDPPHNPFYSYAQCNESTGFYMLSLLYHSTVLAKMEMVALDSGRYCTPSPDISFVHSPENHVIAKYQYRYFLEDSLEYDVQQFLYDPEDSEEVYAKRNFDDVVLYFKSKRDEECFLADLERHPERLDDYLKQEEEPPVYTGNENRNKEYAKMIQVSRALKRFQKDWEKRYGY